MLKKFILENIKKEPAIVLLAIMFMYFLYNEKDKRDRLSNCEDKVSVKDAIIEKQNERLLNFALKEQEYKSNMKATDSLIRDKTEAKVKQILKNN